MNAYVNAIYIFRENCKNQNHSLVNGKDNLSSELSQRVTWYQIKIVHCKTCSATDNMYVTFP